MCMRVDCDPQRRCHERRALFWLSLTSTHGSNRNITHLEKNNQVMFTDFLHEKELLVWQC